MSNDIVYGATPANAFRIFTVNLETMTLHSLNPRPGINRFGELWVPGEPKVAKCSLYFLRQRMRFVNAHGGIEIRNHDPHDAPVWGCTCGIWSCKSRSAIAKTYPMQFIIEEKKLFGGLDGAARTAVLQNSYLAKSIFISSRIEQWGRVIEHEWGWRSEFARIIPQTIQIYPRNVKTKRDKLIVESLRRKYSND